MLERLADADAFSSLGLTRREALWAAKALGRVGDRDDDLPLFVSTRLLDQPRHRIRDTRTGIALPPMPLGEEVVNDYRFLRLSLRAHPAQFLRADLAQRGIVRNEALRGTANNARVRISGLVTCRQRPGSAKGVVFMTIEDESAMANVIVWPKVFERVRPVVLGARYVAVSGRVQEESGVIHVVAEQLEDLTVLLARLAEHGADIDGLARCDEVRRPVEDQREAAALGGRHTRLVRLMREMPELAADLDVPAPGSAHAPTKSFSSFRDAPKARARNPIIPVLRRIGFRVRPPSPFGLWWTPRNDRELLRHHVAAANIDAIGRERAVRLLLRAQNCDMRAGLQLALVADRIGEDDSLRRHHDLLLAALILDREHLTVDAGDGLIDRAVGHGAVRPRTPRPEALAYSALHRREHRHLDGALAAVGLRHGADADIGARLDIGERRLADAEHSGVVGEPDLQFAELLGFDRQHMAVEAFDRAGDTH